MGDWGDGGWGVYFRSSHPQHTRAQKAITSHTSYYYSAQYFVRSAVVVPGGFACFSTRVAASFVHMQNEKELIRLRRFTALPAA